jgi:hypothetical protein
MVTTANKPAMVEARWVIKILTGIIGGLLVLFFFVGWMSERQDTQRMKACVSQANRQWINTDCVIYEPKKEYNG